MPKQQAVLKQQGVSPQLVSQQVLMQHAGQEPQPEAATSTGRLDAAPDDAALVSNACLFWVPGGGGLRGDGGGFDILQGQTDVIRAGAM